MTTAALQTMAEMRRHLLAGEELLGLNVLSPTERDLYYAACDLARKEPIFRTADLIAHPLAAPIPRPTFFRAIKSLTKSGYLIMTERGRYTIKETGQ